MENTNEKEPSLNRLTIHTFNHPIIQKDILKEVKDKSRRIFWETAKSVPSAGKGMASGFRYSEGILLVNYTQPSPVMVNILLFYSDNFEQGYTMWKIHKRCVVTTDLAPQDFPLFRSLKKITIWQALCKWYKRHLSCTPPWGSLPHWNPGTPASSAEVCWPRRCLKPPPTQFVIVLLTSFHTPIVRQNTPKGQCQNGIMASGIKNHDIFASPSFPFQKILRTCPTV